MWSILFVFGHGYVPRSAKWSNRRDCAQSFGKTDDDAKVLARQIAGNTHTMEHDEEQFCYTETRIDAVQKSIAKLGPAWRRRLRSAGNSIPSSSL